MSTEESIIWLTFSPTVFKGARSTKTLVKDVFFSAFSSPKSKRKTASLAFASSFGFPRIAVVGVPTAFFAPRMKQKVRGKSTTHSILWAHRIKGNAKLSWQSFRRQDTLGLVGAVGHNKSKPKTDQGSLPAKPIGERAKQLKDLRGLRTKDGAWKVDRAPVVPNPTRAESGFICSTSRSCPKRCRACFWSLASSLLHC
ncbi:hypothetical protein BRARA_A02586 [Brassica rapa]|uniref:Ribosomal protein L2 C-terminal domain-containing protein n=1 Tax=Brassica campestris TaxID=3711 RepID=A0A398AQN0_BRACM|nr:hypothetical protein BRARA_A02586 [Brassica rapa]